MNVDSFAAKVGVISFVKALEGDAEYYERKARREPRNRATFEGKAKRARDAIARILLGAALARALVDRR